MQSRFAIVLMSVAGAAVLFGIGFALGLGVLASPPAAQQHHEEIAVADQPTKVTRPETNGQGAHDDRALTPLYPASPAGPTAQAAPPQSVSAASDVGQHAPPAQPVAPTVTRAGKTEPAPATKTATPVALQSSKACDVDACARAYQSFRESDCTYQPYSGPRRICVSPPGAKEASRAADRRIDGSGTALDDTDGPAVRRYHRDFAVDGNDDRIVVPADADRGDASEEDDQ